MAITATPVRRNDVTGNFRVTVTDVLLDSSYATGGEALLPSDLGLQRVYHAICEVKARGANGPISARYDIANQKILALSGTGEVANATDLSAATVTVTAFGA